MIQEGTITAEEGMELLDAVNEQTEAAPKNPDSQRSRFLRVRVDGDKTKR